MSKDKKTEVSQSTEVKPAEAKLSDMDRMSLELAKAREQAARSQYETAALASRHIVLQIYMKYGLTEADAIKDDGTIVKDGALANVEAK